MQTEVEKTLYRLRMADIRAAEDFKKSPAAKRVEAIGNAFEKVGPYFKTPNRRPVQGSKNGAVETYFERPASKADDTRPSRELIDGQGPDPFRYFTPGDEELCAPIEDTFKGNHVKTARELWESILKHETGKIGDPVELKKSEERQKHLEEDSIEFAMKLEEAGIEAFDRSEWKVVEFWPNSKTEKKAVPLRRMNILPLVAQSNRSKLVRSLEAELERFEWARMFTFTSGKRVGLSGLRTRIQKHHRRLSKLNYFLKSIGVEMFWRSTELGKPRDFDLLEEADKDAGTIGRNESGEISFHVHSHCCIRFLNGKPFTSEQWEEVKAKIKSRWKFNWDDSGLVGRQDNGERKPIYLGARELVKYITKPGELKKLSSLEAGELYRQLFRLRMVTPMGILKKELKARRDMLETLYKQPGPEGSTYQWGPDWNRSPEDYTSTGEALIATAGKLSVGKKDASRETDELILLASLPPSYPPGQKVKEPKFRFLCKRWDAQTALRVEAVVDALKLTRDTYKAAKVLEMVQDHEAAKELLPLGFTRGDQLSTKRPPPDFEPPPRPDSLESQLPRREPDTSESYVDEEIDTKTTSESYVDEEIDTKTTPEEREAARWWEENCNGPRLGPRPEQKDRAQKTEKPKKSELWRSAADFLKIETTKPDEKNIRRNQIPNIQAHSGKNHQAREMLLGAKS